MIRRTIGVVLILVGLSGLALCYVGAMAGRELADNVATSADGMLSTAADTLDTVEESLEHSRQTVTSVNETIGQVQTTTANLALTVDATQPTLDELSELVGEAIPGTISDVQATIPNIAQTAKVVDDTLRLLSRMRIEETVPIINYDISVGLGIDYDPEIPFDQAVDEVGRGLDPIALASGNLESELETTSANMAVLSQDLGVLADSLEQMNEDIAGFRSLLDEYSSLVADMRADIDEGRASLAEQVAASKKVIVAIAIWLGLFQLLPLYFGLELAMGNRMIRVVEAPATAVVPGSTESSIVTSASVATKEIASADALAVEDMDDAGHGVGNDGNGESGQL